MLLCGGVAYNSNHSKDPTVLSVAQIYGHSDIGQRGIDAFIASHKCNSVCVMLKLPQIKHLDGAKHITNSILFLFKLNRFCIL